MSTHETTHQSSTLLTFTETEYAANLHGLLAFLDSAKANGVMQHFSTSALVDLWVKNMVEKQISKGE